MTDLDDLKQRLDAAREQASPQKKKESTSRPSGMGVGFRIATEMVAAVVVGLVIGYYLDQFLGTRPWLLLAFFFLGVAAAFMNAIRTGQELEAERKAEQEKVTRAEVGLKDNQAQPTGWSDEDEEPWRFDQK